MIKKVVIATLVVVIIIEKLRHEATKLKPKLPRMLVSEVDDMLYKFNMNPQDRIAMKNLLVKKKIMNENYTDIEVPFPIVNRRPR